MIKLHLGCGKRYLGPDWVHIDGNNYAHVRHYDIINPPYDDSTVDMIYRSHVL
jgi:predicted SAM-dependent methyltransferase